MHNIPLETYYAININCFLALNFKTMSNCGLKVDKTPAKAMAK